MNSSIEKGGEHDSRANTRVSRKFWKRWIAYTAIVSVLATILESSFDPFVVLGKMLGLMLFPLLIAGLIKFGHRLIGKSMNPAKFRKAFVVTWLTVVLVGQVVPLLFG